MKTIQEVTSKAGKASAEKRLGGLTQEERSALMRKVRMSKEEKAEFEKGLDGMVNNLNKNAQ